MEKQKWKHHVNSKHLLKQVFKVFYKMTVAIDDSQDLCKVQLVKQWKSLGKSPLDTFVIRFFTWPP